MSDILIFNHHSLPFQALEQIDDAIRDFLKIGLGAQKIGLNVILCDNSVDTSWFRLELFKGYFWQDWYNQHKTEGRNRELIRSFRSLTTRQPLFSSDDIARNSDLFDAHLPGSQTSLPALLAASWNKSPLLGFPTRSPWNQSPIEIILKQLDENDEIVDSRVFITNLYSLQVFQNLKSEIQAQRINLIKSGKELIEKQSILFPDLSFCGKAKEQLENWSHSIKILLQAKESLVILNSFSERWQNGELSEYTHETLRGLGLNHDVSGESTTVKQKSTLRKKREFWLPTGHKKLFESHIKLSSGYRLHFYPDPKSRSVFVGYIGPHLPL